MLEITWFWPYNLKWLESRKRDRTECEAGKNDKTTTASAKSIVEEQRRRTRETTFASIPPVFFLPSSVSCFCPFFCVSCCCFEWHALLTSFIIWLRTWSQHQVNRDLFLPLFLSGRSSHLKSHCMFSSKNTRSFSSDNTDITGCILREKESKRFNGFTLFISIIIWLKGVKLWMKDTEEWQKTLDRTWTTYLRQR